MDSSLVMDTNASSDYPLESLEPAADTQVASQPYVGRWNRLVSTTNWEKGRIIADWREELEKQELPQTQFSDETWAQLVGGVSGQHVGRLRRVYQRFGASFEQFTGLFWSHFQAALDWPDAEMWLEGAVQNGWSISGMRRQREETNGEVGSSSAAQAPTNELTEDDTATERSLNSPISARYEEAHGRPTPEGPDFGDDDRDYSGSSSEASHSSDDSASSSESYSVSAPAVRPFVDLPPLPADVADAFESFKLALLRHKTEGWKDISRDDFIAAIDSLKQLALAPGEQDAPF